MLRVVTPLSTLQTQVTAGGEAFAEPTVQVLRAGADTCVFLSNSQPNDNAITSFTLSGMSPVGNYNDPEVQDSSFGIALAAHGTFLFAGYGDDNLLLGYVGVWQIGTDCSLTLLNTYEIGYRIRTLVVTPNGQTLVLSLTPSPYGQAGAVDSFSIAQNGSLSERGPYTLPSNTIIQPVGVDVTKDSKYAIFAIESKTTFFTAMEVIEVAGDGSLKHPTLFDQGTLGQGLNVAWASLSPDERFLYVSDSSRTLTTLAFTENPLNITFACSTILPGSYYLSGRPSTALPTGAGSDLYAPEEPVAPGGANDFVVLATINSTTGCITQAAGSPFTDGHDGILRSVAPWPPRPF
jgi:6-phosphogluconolactonase (cycloisomerase 2 family)